MSRFLLEIGMENLMISAEVWGGIESLLDKYAKIEKNDIAIVAYTPDSREAAALVSMALELRNIECKSIWMNPLVDHSLAERLKKEMPGKLEPGCKIHLFSFEMDTLSHSDIFRDAFKKYNNRNYKIIRAISACPELFSTAIYAEPDALSARNTTIIENCTLGDRLKISTNTGTELLVKLDTNKYRWISNHGIWRPGDTIVLPAGEVATYPSHIEGKLVADYALNVNLISDIDARLHRTPVTVLIENSKAVDFECESPTISNLIKNCFEKENGRNVGEIGFGTNYFSLTSLSKNSHINERHPGIHLGFGQHNQHGTVDYFCDTHLDLIADGGLVEIVGTKKSFDLANLEPSKNQHPKIYVAEDAFAPNDEMRLDCCGTICES